MNRGVGRFKVLAIVHILCWMGVGVANADVLAGWRKINSQRTTSMFITAHTSHPNLVSATFNYRVTNIVDSAKNSRFYLYNDNDWFYLEPFYTGTLVNGISATNQFWKTVSKSYPITNYFEYAFSPKPGYKVVITNFMCRMMNDEQSLWPEFRAEKDNWTTTLCTWSTTNYFKLYTNSLFLESKEPVVRLRLYGTRAKSRYVYAYWAALGEKIPGISSSYAGLPPSTNAYPAGCSNLMMVFQGRVEPLADVFPPDGPLAGGNYVLVTNAFLTNAIAGGSDITSVTLNGVSVLPLHGQGTNWFSFTAPPGSSPGEKDMVVYSTSKGTNWLTYAYTYNPTGVILRASPTGGIAGISVRILGSNLCSVAGDITNMTLGNTVVAPISASPTQVVFAAPSGSGVVGARIWSTSYGYSENPAVFTYAGPATQPELKVLGTNGAVTASGSAAGVALGTDFGLVRRGYGATNSLAITNAGTAVLNISGVSMSGAGAAYFRVLDYPSTLAVGAAGAFRVAFDAEVAGTHTAAVQMASNDSLSPFVLNLSGTTVPGRIGTAAASGITTVGVVEATTSFSQPNPIKLEYSYYHQQHVYSAAQLAAAGLTNVQITAMGFDVVQVLNPHIQSNYVIRLKETARTGWTGGDKAMESTGLAPVYSNATVPFVVGNAPTLVLNSSFALGDSTSLLVDCGFARKTVGLLGGQVKRQWVPFSVVLLQRDSEDALSVFADSANVVNALLPVMTVAWQRMSDAGVSPAMCPSTGGVVVTISGTNLCNGTLGDVTSVTLCGAAATVQSVAGSTQIVVVAGSGGTIGPGAVEIVSAQCGRTAVANVFTYNATGEIGAGWASEGWTPVVGLPGRGFYGAAGVLNGALYSIGGYDASWSMRTNVYRFDGNAWTEVAGLPAVRTYLAAAELNGSLYAIGGYAGGSSVTNVYRYNGTNWSEVAGLPAARNNLAAGVLNGAIYAVGGGSGPASTNVFRFDGTSWTEVASLPSARQQHSVAVLNGRLYSMGGVDAASGYRANVYQYDGTNWTEVLGLPVPRNYFAAWMMNGALYAAGGYESVYTPSTNTYRYDGVNWTEVSGLPTALAALSVGGVSGSAYTVGGTGTNAYRYAPGGFALSGVMPDQGTNGSMVTISGRNLCNGSTTDVTSVTLCGTAATVLSAAGSTQIVVRAGDGTGTGDVVVDSVLFGRTVKENGFIYVGAPEMRVLGTNLMPIASGADPTRAAGTDFGVLPAGSNLIHALSITNAGLMELNITGVTTNEP